MLRTVFKGGAGYPARIIKGTVAGLPLVIAAAHRSGRPTVVNVTIGERALRPQAPGVTLVRLPVKGLAAAIRAAVSRAATAFPGTETGRLAR